MHQQGMGIGDIPPQEIGGFGVGMGRTTPPPPPHTQTISFCDDVMFTCDDVMFTCDDVMCRDASFT